jgi:hypothetical protein
MDDQRTNREVGGSVRRSKLQDFSSGARRGAKFGAAASVVIFLGIYALGIVVNLAVPELRERALADLGERSVLSTIAGALAVVSLMVLYGAIPGAIIMGIAALIRGHRSDAGTQQK